MVEPSRSEEERGFAALVEQVRSEVRVVAEGHGTIICGQEELRAMVTSLDDRIGLIERAIGSGLRELRQITSDTQEHVARLSTQFQTHEHSHLH